MNTLDELAVRKNTDEQLTTRERTAWRSLTIIWCWAILAAVAISWIVSHYATERCRIENYRTPPVVEMKK